MSVVEEEVELRDLLAQTLESNGCLPKLRAELRASVFLALDEDLKLSKQQPLQNLQVRSYLKTPEGRSMFFLVKEFLEFFNLQFTISVYESESYLDQSDQYSGREELARELGLDIVHEPTVPLLQQVLKIAQIKSKVVDINLNDKNTSNNGNYKKTDNMSNDESQLVNDRNLTFDITSSPVMARINEDLKENSLNGPSVELTNETLNKTFSASNLVCDQVILPRLLNEIKEDDTYEDTSSITEDIEKPVSSKNALSDSDINSTILDKSKKSTQKVNNLNSLADLPPLATNKNNGTDILPSLYSKDLKNKSNLKELDKMFDIESEYEEDFMSYNNDFSLNAPSVNLSENQEDNSGKETKSSEI